MHALGCASSQLLVSVLFIAVPTIIVKPLNFPLHRTFSRYRIVIYMHSRKQSQPAVFILHWQEIA